MSSIHIRDINEHTLSSLKRLAKRHHRSLQGELHFILEKFSEFDREDSMEEELNIITVSSHLNTNWSRDEIYESDGR